MALERDDLNDIQRMINDALAPLISAINLNGKALEARTSILADECAALRKRNETLEAELVALRNRRATCGTEDWPAFVTVGSPDTH